MGPYLPGRLWQAINHVAGRASSVSGYSLVNGAAARQIAETAAAGGDDLSYRPSRDSHTTRLRVIGRADFGNYNKGTLAGWGIDQRDPTADRRLVELCLSIPDDQYLRGGRARSLAHSAFSDRLPPQIVEESRKGLQAGDWYVGFCAAQIDAREQVERLAGLAPAQRIFDIERMRGLAAQMPTDGWHSSRVMGAYRLGLLRAISAGHFLRNALGAN